MSIYVDLGPNSKYNVKYRDTHGNGLKLEEWF